MALGMDRPHAVAGEILNHGSWKGLRLGDLLALELQDTLEYVERIDLRRHLRWCASSIWAGLRWRGRDSDTGARVLHFQSGVRDHLDGISQSVRESQPRVGRVTVVGPRHNDDVAYWDIFGQFGVLDLGRAAIVLAINVPRVAKAVQASRPRRGARTALVITLFRQLLMGVSASRFLRQQGSLLLVLADSDRGHDTGVLCTAARAVGLASASIQHSVILPSPVASNYTPLVADSIAVWGKAARDQLVKEGVDPDRIGVVGNPTRTLLKDASTEPTGKPRVKTSGLVALALSAPDETRDRILVAHLAALRRDCDLTELSFAVKLHPTRRPEDFEWVERDYGIPLVPRETPRDELMADLAALLVTNTSFAMEAAAMDIPVGVINLPDVPIGYGQGYVDYLGMPVVDTWPDLRGLVLGHRPVDLAALRSVAGGLVGDQMGRFILERAGYDRRRLRTMA